MYATISEPGYDDRLYGFVYRHRRHGWICRLWGYLRQKQEVQRGDAWPLSSIDVINVRLHVCPANTISACHLPNHRISRYYLNELNMTQLNILY